MDVPIKKSRQREAILQCVLTHHDHPTADAIYQEVRELYPNISLGTVYRNLSLLVRIGKIKKIISMDHSDRYDGILHPHSHFICLSCGSLKDFDFQLNTCQYPELTTEFDGRITEHTVIFQGYCGKCLQSQTHD